jgi:hypothetical protein
MKVTVTWDTIAGPRALAAIREAYPEYEEKTLKKELAAFIAANSPKLKRCMSTEYVVTPEASDVKPRIFRIDADVHMGLSSLKQK